MWLMGTRHGVEQVLRVSQHNLKQHYVKLGMARALDLKITARTFRI